MSAVRPGLPLRHHRHRHRLALDRAAEPVGRAGRARRERQSRLSLFGLRRPAAPASCPSFPGFLSRLPRAAARLALAALLLAGAGTVAAPASADAAKLVGNRGETETGGHIDKLV